MSIFLVSEGQEYSYEDLYRKAVLAENLSPQIRVKSNKPFEVFTKLTSSLIHGCPCEIVDGELSDTELSSLGIDYKDRSHDLYGATVVFKSMDDLVKALTEGRIETTIALYTSGTSGRPKKVDHPVRNLIKTARAKKNHEMDVWAFAYNPTHMAGIQVFFQALINKNPMIDVFGSKISEFLKLAVNYGINRISATPTFYRTLLSMYHDQWPQMLSVSSGGEKLDDKLKKMLEKAFPSAHIYNIYASTEAGALFQAEGNVFSIPEILQSKIRFSDTGEILIHASLLGNSDSMRFEGDWYHTGDVAEMIGPNKFAIKSRLSEMINVGGNKVDPHEIEEIIASFEFIEDVRVYGKKNSVVGEIVAAEIVLSRSVGEEYSIITEIETRLKKVLQGYKIPRFIKIVQALETTRTGKKVRS